MPKTWQKRIITEFIIKKTETGIISYLCTSRKLRAKEPQWRNQNTSNALCPVRERKDYLSSNVNYRGSYSSCCSDCSKNNFYLELAVVCSHEKCPLAGGEESVRNSKLWEHLLVKLLYQVFVPWQYFAIWKKYMNTSEDLLQKHIPGLPWNINVGVPFLGQNWSIKPMS